MKISNLLIATASLLSACAFCACDDIAEDDRFIPVERQEAKRKVLIQEFSGTWCTNCPDGARVIESLQTVYPDSYVVVSMQPEGVSLTRPTPQGFTLATKEARDYYDAFGVSALPSAVFDGGKPFADSRTWDTPAVNALGVETPVILKLTSSYDETTREMTADYEVAFNNVYADKASVLVWITENDIKGFQVDNGKILMDYVHKHVFRASANGLWGTELGESFLPDDKVNGTVRFVLDEAWNADNCHVVAFVFNTGSKAVLQSEEVHLK